MRARLVLWIGLCFGLSGCLLPTPFSIVSSGLDAVSFVASGKTVTDHGVSLVMGEDCALVRVLEGEVCREQREFEEVAEGRLLAPLPAHGDAALLAQTHPEVQAAAVRMAAHDGWTDDGSSPALQPQFAMLTGGFVADDVSPVGYRPIAPPVAPAVDLALAPEAVLEPAAAALPIPKRRPDSEPHLADEALAMGTDAPLLLAASSFVLSEWPDRAEEPAAPALERALVPAGASGPDPILAGTERRVPNFATASYEFGERPTSVRYGSIQNLGGTDIQRRLARHRWGTENHG